MKRTLILLFVLPTACGGEGGSSTRSSSNTDRALAHYNRGDFDAADKQLEAVLRSNPKDFLALRLSGRIALYQNRLEDAESHLLKAIKNVPQNMPVMAVFEDLASTYYRMDNYESLSTLYARMGDPVRATKYRELSKRIAYIFNWRRDPAVVEFEARTPLPLLRVWINDVPGLFSLDTGAGEIVLNEAFARRARAKGVGVRTGNFIGKVKEGFVEKVRLDAVTVKNVPVHIRPLQPIGEEKIDGILGVSFLLHYPFTIDYRKGRLIWRKTALSPSVGTDIPFSLVGERFVVVRVRLDERETFALVNTGMAKYPLALSQGTVFAMSSGSSKKYAPASVAFGPIKLIKPEYSVAAFPAGLDTIFGFPIGAALGDRAFRNRILTFHPKEMKITIR